jgi:hypothetical protein
VPWAGREGRVGREGGALCYSYYIVVDIVRCRKWYTLQLLSRCARGGVAGIGWDRSRQSRNACKKLKAYCVVGQFDTYTLCVERTG